MADPARLYRLLLKLYPARFREEYAGPLERQFLDEYLDARGAWARAGFWTRTIFDLAISVPRQLAHEIGQDVRYSLRIYSQRPLMTILILAALALGIGSATGVFSVVNALLIRSLPFRAPERLVELWMFSAPRETPAAFHAWRRESSYLEDAGIYEAGLSYEMNLDANSRAARVKVAETSWNFFSMLGSDPILGRSFLPGEDVPGHDDVAVLGYGLWQEVFGGDPRVIGSTIHLNGQPMTVVGIARPAFDYPYKASVWTPTAFDVKRLPKNGPVFWETVGRLKPGLREQQVVDMFMAEVAHRRQADNHPSLKPLRDQLAGPVGRASLVLLGAVVFVLLIACANVANLLLARFNGRRAELALRIALGASRARLLQQLVVESVLLTSVAAAAGTLVANWAARLASLAQPARLDLQGDSLLDWRVFGFAAGAALLTGTIFGVVPASLAGRSEIRERATPSRGRFQRGLVALQVALAIVLVSGAIVMGRGFLNMLHTDLGFRTAHTVTMSVSLLGTRYESTTQRRQYYDRVLERLRAVPGVEAAGAVDYLPLDAKAFVMGSFVLDTGAPAPRGTRIVTATSGYFRAMGSDISYGRDFSSNPAPAELEAIVNEEFARAVGGPEALIGRHMKCPWIKEPIVVVGVARTFRYAGPSHEGGPQVYFSEQQLPPVFATFTSKVTGRPQAYLAICRDRIQSLDRSVPVFNVKTLDDRLSENLASPRLYTTAGMFFGGFALLLAIIGTYGVASQSVAQRTHEIGVRIAVGGTPGVVRAMLLGQSMWPVLAGMAAGLWGAMALGSVLQMLVDAAEPVNWVTCEAAAALLALFAAGAIWSASRRVTVLNAVEILRAE